MVQKIRGTSLLLGAMFILIAISGLLGRFDDVERAKVILPIAIIVVGVSAIASGVKALLNR
jgi:hypothetical protein